MFSRRLLALQPISKLNKIVFSGLINLNDLIRLMANTVSSAYMKAFELCTAIGRSSV